MAPVDLAGIFGKRHVANPMDAILDAPMATPPSKQSRCVRLSARSTGDGVLDFGHLFAASMRLSYEAADLGQTWPVQLAAQPRTGLQPSTNAAAVFFPDRLGNVKVRFPLLFVRRGKKPP